MSKKIIRNTAFYTLGGVLPKTLTFILLPIYTRYLSPSDYGITNSMAVLSSVLMILFTLAIDRSIFRLFFDYVKNKSEKRYLGTIFISVTVISSLALLFCLSISSILGLVYKSIPFYPFYVLMLMTLYTGIFANVPETYFMVTEKAKSFTFLTVTRFLVTVAFTLYFIVGQGEGAIGFLKGGLFGNVFFLPIYLLITSRIITASFDWSIFKQTLMFSLPFIPGLLTAWIVNLSDRIFIERFFTLNDVGIYSLGYTIAGVILVFTSSLDKAYSPFFYKTANSNMKTSEKKNLLSRYNTAYVSVVILFCFGIALFSKEVIQLLMDSKYFLSYQIIPLIALSYLLSQTDSVFTFSIYQSKKTKLSMYVSLVSSPLNIILNLIMIPRFGIFGAAYATILTFAVRWVMKYKFAKDVYHVPLMWKRIIPILSYVLIASFVFNIISIQSHLLSIALKSLSAGLLLVYIQSQGLFDIKKFVTAFYSIKK